MLLVESCLANRSHLTWQNEFRNAFTDYTVPNKSTLSRLLNRFRDTGTLQRAASNARKRLNANITERGGHVRHLVFRFLISVRLFF
jgi:hypothetical protein